MKQILLIMGIAMLLSACAGPNRKDEIAARKSALKAHQDSALQVTQDELARVDQELLRAQASYDSLMEVLHKGAFDKAGAPELQAQITRARLHRDSMQVNFNVLCGKVRYIHRRQQESEALKKTNTEPNQTPTQR